MTMDQIMSTDPEDNPGVIARPPFLMLGCLVLGLALDFAWPAPTFPTAVQYPVGFALLALGVALMALSVRRFRAAGTNVETYKPTTRIVAEGPYRYSRNPIYLGGLLGYVGIGVAVDSLWVLALLLPFLGVMHFGVILREEAYLEAKFGADYRRYKERVRRWI